MTRKAKTNKSTKITKKDIFETALALRMYFGEQPDEFILEETKTSVRMIVFSQESAEEALPFIQKMLDEQQCKAQVEILVRLKTLTAKSADSQAADRTETPESPATSAQDKISEGLRAYLNQATIPGDKGIDVSVHCAEALTAVQVNERLVALFGPLGARVNDDVRVGNSSSTWVVRVKRALIRNFNKAEWVTKVNRFYGEAQAYSANAGG